MFCVSLQQTNPVFAEIFSIMSKDEARHGLLPLPDIVFDMLLPSPRLLLRSS
jgi:hypothetical protein